jgi:hypothetical protein
MCDRRLKSSSRKARLIRANDTGSAPVKPKPRPELPADHPASASQTSLFGRLRAAASFSFARTEDSGPSRGATSGFTPSQKLDRSRRGTNGREFIAFVNAVSASTPMPKSALRPERKESSMCDYSLHNVASRPARVGDKLVSTGFAGQLTRGFAALGEPNVAVCLLPGTEVAFEKEAVKEPFLPFMGKRKLGQTVARFRHVNPECLTAHHDALEFPDGKVVLLTTLVEGQHATVLQLPVTAAKTAAAIRDGREVSQAAP